MSNFLIFSSGNRVSAHFPAPDELQDEFTAALHSSIVAFDALKLPGSKLIRIDSKKSQACQLGSTRSLPNVEYSPQHFPKEPPHWHFFT